MARNRSSNRAYKRIIDSFKKNYLLAGFISIVIFILILIVYRLIFSNPVYIYVKVYIQQGYYATQPSYWLIDALTKEKQIANKEIAKIQSVDYYPSWQSNQIDVYTIVKIKVNYNRATKEYTYNRNTLSIGSPIQLHLQYLDINGTIEDMSNAPFKYKYLDKIVYLINRSGYAKDFPYIYNSINIGDKYFDGTTNAFEILDKSLETQTWAVTNNFNAQVYERTVDTTQNIVMKARIKVRQEGNYLIYGEQYRVTNNALIPFSTNNLFLSDFVIRSIQ